MGTEIRRLVAHQALDCQDKSLWATGAHVFSSVVAQFYASEWPITSTFGSC